ncbi:MAG TPA: hypothetical protein ENO14_01330 [Chromatiales bacterium]|nr:hypothetical protein [Chromatiales bacterium]
MARVTELCQSVVEDVSDALACGVVDLNTGMFLGVHHIVPHFTQAYLDAVAAASVEMLRGKTVRRVEELLTKQRGQEVINTTNEIFMSSDHVFHFMKVIRDKDCVVVLVTKTTTNQGSGWAALRNAIPDFAGAA